MTLSVHARTGEVRLFVDGQGVVWRKDSSSPGVVSEGYILQALDGAYLNALVESRCRVRMLSSLQHADLIVWLLHRMPFDQLWLGPLRVADADPSLLLLFDEIAPNGLRPSVGGWRASSPADLATYSLASVNRLAPVHTLLGALLGHPAASAVTFPVFGDLSAAIDVLSLLVDPRWHVNPKKPDSRGQLYSYFGLGSRQQKNNMAFLLEPLELGHKPGSHADRAELVLRAIGGRSTVGGLPRCTAALTYDKNHAPRHWLAAYQWAGGLGGKNSVWVLRACRAYLDLVCDVWLESLYPPRRLYLEENGQPRMLPATRYAPQLFVPRHFFPTQDMVVAWESHCVAPQGRAKP